MSAQTSISVKTIWLGAASLQEEQSLEWEAWPLSHDEGPSWHLLEPLEMDIRITKLKDSLLVFLEKWQVSVQENCSICGEEMALDLEGGDTEYLYRPKPVPQKDEEYYLFSLKNFSLDLEPVLSQEFLLAKPLFPCCESCQSHKQGEEILHFRLDDQGAHRFYAEEASPQEPQENPFAVLKDFIKKDDKNS